MRLKTRLSLVSAAALVVMTASACTMTQPLPPPGAEPPTAEQLEAQRVQQARVTCIAIRATARGAETGLLLAELDGKAEIALTSLATGLQSGVADYCDAADRGEPADALRTLLLAFDTAMADFNEQLRAARLAKRRAVSRRWTPGAQPLAFDRPPTGNGITLQARSSPARAG